MPASPYSQPQPTQYRSPGSSVLSPPMPSASQAAREARRDAMSERKEQAQIDAEIKHTLANSRLVPTANAVPAPVPDLGSARPPIAPGTIPYNPALSTTLPPEPYTPPPVFAEPVAVKPDLPPLENTEPIVEAKPAPQQHEHHAPKHHHGHTGHSAEVEIDKEPHHEGHHTEHTVVIDRDE